MQKRLLETQGPAAARSFYEGSVLRSVLWNCLLSLATSKEMCDRILRARARLSANVNDGQVAVDLAALSDEDRAAIDKSKLVAAILREFDPHPQSIAPSSSSVEGEDHDAIKVQRSVDSLLTVIRQTGRQEERIAFLMAAVLADPPVGKSALLQLQSDRAKTADWAIKELRKTFIDTKWPSDEQVIAALVPKLFTRQWPMRRGDLLFFLAKHLWKWPIVNAAISETLQKSHSMYVDFSRREIEDILAGNLFPETAAK